MEKKVKKLQLRKETIVVLTGEKMTRVIGGLNYCGAPYDEIDMGNGVVKCGFVGTAAVCDGTNACAPTIDHDVYWSIPSCIQGETVIVNSVYCSSNVNCETCKLSCNPNDCIV